VAASQDLRQERKSFGKDERVEVEHEKTLKAIWRSTHSSDSQHCDDLYSENCRADFQQRCTSGSSVLEMVALEV